METTFFALMGSCKNPPRKGPRICPDSARPRFDFRFSDQWRFSRVSTPALPAAPDFKGLAFHAGFEALAKQAHRRLSRLEGDFLWLALAVYLADRFAPRRPYGINGPEFWRRRIHVQVPVSDSAVWENTCGLLVQALEYLTEDDWSFEFTGGRAGFAAECQDHFSAVRGPQTAWTALFSGGLDSLAGAISWLRRTGESCLLVSGQTHNRIIAGQEALVTSMRKIFPHRIDHAGVDYGVADKYGITGFESSQRTRAFIHTALGSLAALMSGRRQMFLFENGFGALNLPCDSAQLGSQNSRGTHPVFLRRMSAFVSAAFSQPFMIANPFTLHTKAQMLEAAGGARFTKLFKLSFSCDRYPNYPRRASQCGCCASCLVRRLSLYTAGMGGDGTAYSMDIFRQRQELRASQLLAFSKLTAQADTIRRCLHSRNPWGALCGAWPDLLRTEMEIGSSAFPEHTVALLRRHEMEWRSFYDAVHPMPLALAA